MNLVFIRHLPVPGNIKKQYIGRTDECLEEDVIRSFIEGSLSGGPGQYPRAETVICSPMKRCVMTAELIYPGKKLRMEPMLTECDFGEFEGKTYRELKDRKEYIRWLESGGMTAFPGGEAQEDFRRRCACGVKKWIRYLLDQGAEDAAFVVHGGTIMAAMAELAEGEHGFYDWQVPNGNGFSAKADRESWKNGREILTDVRRIDNIRTSSLL